MTLRFMSCLRDLRGIPPMPPVPSRQDPVKTLRWRRRQLIAARLDELSAHQLAGRRDVYLHAVLTLQDTGPRVGLDRGETSHAAGDPDEGAPHV